MAAARSIRATSPASLTDAQSLDDPVGRHQPAGRRTPTPTIRTAAHVTSIGLEPDGRRHRRPRRPTPRAGPATPPMVTVDLAGHPGCGQLLGGLGPVAPVGGEHARVPRSTSSTPADPVNPVSQRILAGVVTSRASGRGVRHHPRSASAARTRSRRPATDSGASGPAVSSAVSRRRPLTTGAVRMRDTASTANG